jgi:REP element-mobilizing transposase RayT
MHSPSQGQRPWKTATLTHDRPNGPTVPPEDFVMPQSLSRVWLHLVFSTKDRRAYLQQEKFRNEMFPMLSHHVEQMGCTPVRAGGWIDHVHVVCGLSRTVTIAQLVEGIKTETSKWAKKAPHSISTFSWQAGYGAFSVSQSNLSRVLTYVDNQPEHHRQLSFQDEFRSLCKRHEIEIDERYVWD